MILELRHHLVQQMGLGVATVAVDKFLPLLRLCLTHPVEQIVGVEGAGGIIVAVVTQQPAGFDQVGGEFVFVGLFAVEGVHRRGWDAESSFVKHK